MTREQRLAEALARLSPEARLAADPLLRIIVHDLAGALSVLTLESFTIAELARRVEGPSESPERRSELTNLREASVNVQQTTEELAAYLARLGELVG